MTVTTIQTGSKPDAIAALRATWRKSAEHAAEQLARFVRIFLLSAPVPLVDLLVKGSNFDWETLLIVLAPIGETAWRQVFPALGAAKADSADGVTIVPEQVGLPPSDTGTDDDGLPAPTGVPVQTDNGARPEDPSSSEPVNQDPNWIPTGDDVAETDPSVLS